jgi:hypothetical protein
MTSVRPSSTAFFDLGPTLLPPAPDGFLVPLGRSVHRLLAAPATGFQDAADLRRIVSDAESVSNQCGHSGLDPHITLAAEGFRPLDQ